ncbi:MAG: hypothetical protein SVT52_00070 [Planctomycetota bacterium]|nr:hypothetical protein [Planctomycetota bacterium]
MRQEVDVNLAPSRSLAEAVRLCRDNANFLASLLHLYGRADAELAGTGVVCLAGGACCKFDLTEHRLYVSTGELALLSTIPPPRPKRCLRQRCPWQIGPRCNARNNRPLGCRTFFCDKRQKDFRDDLYERTYREIRSLHQRHCLPYAYIELAAALLQLTQES